jgi:hypothetical protein
VIHTESVTLRVQSAADSNFERRVSPTLALHSPAGYIIERLRHVRSSQNDNVFVESGLEPGNPFTQGASPEAISEPLRRAI